MPSFHPLPSLSLHAFLATLQKILFSAPLSVLLAIGLLVRLTALLVYLSTHHWQGEQWEYELLAQNMLSGRGFVIERYNALYYAFVPPLFPLICYLLHLAGGTGPTYLILYYTYHIGLALGTIWLSYRLAFRWFGRSTATMAGLLVALEPGLIIYQSYKMDVITLSTFLLLAALALLHSSVEGRNLLRVAAFGALLGLGLLTRMDLIILAGPLVLWLAQERRRGLPVMTPLAVALVACLIVVSPWIIRHYLVLDRFVFIASTTGEWLWIGNSRNSIGTAVDLNGEGIFNVAPEAFKHAVLAASNEFETNRIFMNDAVGYITEDPWHYARAALSKFWYFWWFTPTYGLKYQHIGEGWRLAYMALHGAVLLFTVIGVLSIFQEYREMPRQGALIILTLCLMLAGIHSLTYVEGRHRLMVEPLILIIASAGIWAVIKQFPQRE